MNVLRVESAPASEYNALYAHFEPMLARRVANSVGGLGLGVGESVRDNILPIVSQFSSTVDDMALAAIYFKELSISTYVQGVYIWVEQSPRVASLVVVQAYGIGNSMLNGTNVAMKIMPDMYVSALETWTNTTTRIAKSVVLHQLSVGETTVTTLANLRQASSRMQHVAGDRLAIVASEAYTNTFGPVEGVPHTATAAVADFLILEAK